MSADENQAFKFELKDQYKLRDIFCGYYNACLFTDCTIVARNGESMNVHRVILAQSSEYFAKLFYLRNSDANIVIALPNISFEDLKYVIKFIYVGELTIDEKSLDGFMFAAETLQIKDIGTGKPLPINDEESDKEDEIQTELGLPIVKRRESSFSSSNDSLSTSTSTSSSNPKSKNEMPKLKRSPNSFTLTNDQNSLPKLGSTSNSTTSSKSQQLSQSSLSLSQKAVKSTPKLKRSKSCCNVSTPTEKPPKNRRASSSRCNQRFTVMKKGNDKLFTCVLCQKIFRSQRNVNRHYLICLFNPDRMIFKCRFCPRTFVARHRCTAHEKTHPEASIPQVLQDETMSIMNMKTST